MSFQQLIVVGNLGRDPEMRYMPNGDAVTDISVATTRVWNGNDGARNEETTWIRASLWRRQAEIASQYLQKGRQVMLIGRLRPDPTTGGPRTYERQDGTVGASYEMHVTQLVLLGSRNETVATVNVSEGDEAPGPDFG